MEAISIKLDDRMLDDMDKTIKRHHFSTRTEFVRTAIREKLEKLTKEELMKRFLATAGSAKKKVSDKNLRRARELVSREYMNERGLY